jgi:hypothetical protein
LPQTRFADHQSLPKIAPMISNARCSCLQQLLNQGCRRVNPVQSTVPSAMRSLKAHRPVLDTEPPCQFVEILFKTMQREGCATSQYDWVGLNIRRDQFREYFVGAGRPLPPLGRTSLDLRRC